MDDNMVQLLSGVNGFGDAVASSYRRIPTYAPAPTSPLLFTPDLSVKGAFAKAGIPTIAYATYGTGTWGQMQGGDDGRLHGFGCGGPGGRMGCGPTGARMKLQGLRGLGDDSLSPNTSIQAAAAPVAINPLNDNGGGSSAGGLLAGLAIGGLAIVLFDRWGGKRRGSKRKAARRSKSSKRKSRKSRRR